MADGINEVNQKKKKGVFRASSSLMVDGNNEVNQNKKY